MSSNLSPLQLYKAFLEAERADDVLMNFYKLRLSFGLGPAAIEPVKDRFEVMRSKVLPICDSFFMGRRLFTSLHKKMCSVHEKKGLSITVVGAGPVGLRCAIELALFGMKVTVVERYTPDKVATRPNVLKVKGLVVRGYFGWRGACNFDHWFCSVLSCSYGNGHTMTSVPLV
jgi:hypothetical protein